MESVVLMRDTKVCPKCNSRNIAGPHNLNSHAGRLRILLSGRRTATLNAFTCLNCGYTELFSDAMGLNNLEKYGDRYT